MGDNITAVFSDATVNKNDKWSGREESGKYPQLKDSSAIYFDRDVETGGTIIWSLSNSKATDKSVQETLFFVVFETASFFFRF